MGTGAFMRSGPRSVAASITARLSAALDVRLSRFSGDSSDTGQRGIQPPERLLAPEQLEGLEYPRRDRRPDDRDADRLEDLLRLGRALLDNPAQRLVEVVGVPLGHVGEHVAREREHRATVVVEP